MDVADVSINKQHNHTVSFSEKARIKKLNRTLSCIEAGPDIYAFTNTKCYVIFEIYYQFAYAGRVTVITMSYCC